MVRIGSHVEDEEAPDCYSPIEGVRLDQKVDASRSKHSETEQRRRSKINERFQILRDLVPENDQKRDKASLLLEVIQYIQFLQEKLQMYEGSYQGWSPEPTTKLAPWKINSGPVESFLDQIQLEKHISGHEDNGVLNPLRHVRNSVESEFIGSSLYKSTDNLPIATNQPLLLNLPTKAATFEGMSGRSHQECFPDAEQLTQLSQSQSWPGRSCVNDYSFPICNTNENEPNIESGEASHSSTCSQLILSSLKYALQSSGVDLSQASISVQLDVGKQINDRSTMAKFKMKYLDIFSICGNCPQFIMILSDYLVGIRVHLAMFLLLLGTNILIKKSELTKASAMHAHTLLKGVFIRIIIVHLALFLWLLGMNILIKGSELTKASAMPPDKCTCS